MAVELYINNLKADLEDDIKLKKSFQDPQELIVQEVEYSYSVDLPITATNAKIFKKADVISSTHNFELIYKAQIFDGAQIVFDGNFLLQSVNSEYYSGNLYVEAGQEVTDILSDKKLTDITPHYFTIQNLSDITKQNNVVLGLTIDGDNHICFPYVLYNIPSNDYEDTDISTNVNAKYIQYLSDDSYNLYNIYPAFNVLSVIKDIFSSYNLNVEGNIFDDDRFTGLYQTYSGDKDILNDIYYPYLSFDFNYINIDDITDATTISSTLTKSDIEDLDGMTIGFDALLSSEKTTLSNINNNYNILGVGDDSYSITIPKEGWYQINCDVEISLPFNGSNIYAEGENVNVGTTLNAQLVPFDFRGAAYEFQIIKGSSPTSSPQLYSLFGQMPVNPIVYDEDYVMQTRNGRISYCGDTNLGGQGWAGLSIGYWQKFQDDYIAPLSTYNAKIRDLEGFDTDNFIAGARWGDQSFCYSFGESALQKANYKATTMLALPRSGITVENCLSNFGYGSAPTGDLLEYTHFPFWSIRRPSSSNYNYDDSYHIFSTGYTTSVCLTRDDSLSNYGGYRTIELTDIGTKTSSDNGKFENYTIELSTGYNGRSEYPGQEYSRAYVTDYNNGNASIHTCVYLEEGDILNLCIASGWANKHSSTTDGWVVGTELSGNFEMYFVSADQSYTPTSNNPISQYSGGINYNSLLPDQTCSDFFENFINTFNLSVTKTSSNTYSLDTKTDIYNCEVINLDKYINASSMEIEVDEQIKSYSLNWTIDDDEAGYVYGNNSPFISEEDSSKPSSDANYDGSKIYYNYEVNSGDEEERTSEYSYNWYQTINFIDEDRGIDWDIPVPVIYSSDKLSSSISAYDAYEDGYETDLSPRLFYINTYKQYDSSTSTNRAIQYIPFYNNKETIDGLRLIVPSNYIYTYNNEGTYSFFVLDYNDSKNNISTNSCISTIFFTNIKLYLNYMIIGECVLPNFIFSKITINSLIVYNGSLYRVNEIDGHSLNGSAFSNIKLTRIIP